MDGFVSEVDVGLDDVVEDGAWWPAAPSRLAGNANLILVKVCKI